MQYARHSFLFYENKQLTAEAEGNVQCLFLRFSWKIWRSSTPIATAEEILSYLHEAVSEQGLADKIRFQMDIATADWSSDTNRWTLTTTTGM